MKKILPVLFVLLFRTLVCSAQSQEVASQFKPAAGGVLDLVVAGVDNGDVKWLVKKQVGRWGEQDNYLVAFSQNGKRYSIFFGIVSASPRRGFREVLRFSVRPEGTQESKDLDTFTLLAVGPSDFDGSVVDSGISGGVDSKHFDVREKTGLEWREYWQGRLKEALIDTLNYLESHCGKSCPYDAIGYFRQEVAKQ